jgi:hypothetical protein
MSSHASLNFARPSAQGVSNRKYPEGEMYSVNNAVLIWPMASIARDASPHRLQRLCPILDRRHWAPSPPPVNTSAVNALDRVDYSMGVPVIMDSLAARGERAIVVND